MVVQKINFLHPTNNKFQLGFAIQIGDEFLVRTYKGEVLTLLKSNINAFYEKRKKSTNFINKMFNL